MAGVGRGLISPSRRETGAHKHAQRGFELLNPETRGRPLGAPPCHWNRSEIRTQGSTPPGQAQIEATGVKTIRIGHEQLEENNREFYENRAVLRKAAH
jgi:hypothetical protein